MRIYFQLQVAGNTRNARTRDSCNPAHINLNTTPTLENLALILPPEVDIDSHEEDEQDYEEWPPVKSHRHPPISPALRVRETLEYGREGDDESEHYEGAAEEADL